MIHLNCRTSYSFMRGYGDVAQWNERAKTLGAQYAVADYCSTWGHVLFAGHAGLGVQLPIVSVLAKEPAHSLGTILAHDQEGLEALYELFTLAQGQMYYRPRVTWEQVKEFMEGHGSLIVDVINPVELSAWSKVGFGCLGIGISGSSFNDAAAKEFPAVIAPGAQYPSSDDRKAWEAVRAAGRNHRQGEYDGSGTHMLSRADMDVVLRSRNFDVARLWDATEEMASNVRNVKLPQAELIKPVDLPLLHKMLEKGVESRFGQEAMPLEYEERLAHELKIIRGKDFEDYFRFVADVVQWSKRRFLVGPGRGSSGGSLVCFLLGITDVDPLVHGTMFARFIDPGRADLPDIDVDFPDVRRDDVFAYLREKYGEDRVAKLGTISRWHAASAINDVTRTGEIDRDDARKLKERAEVLDHKLSITVDIDADAKAIADRNPGVAIACDMEGKPRHSGVHAAGVVLAEQTLTRFGVVDAKGVLSLDLEGAEAVGLLKFDALGLRTLAVVQACMEMGGLEPNDYHNILSDLGSGGTTNPKVWQLFQDDRVTGIFQFEGHSVRELAKKVKVDRFSDLCALTSLARPGPLYSGQADKWCAMRNGDVEPEYLSEKLIDVTAETFGQIVYQEQAMELTRVLAGFDDVMINRFRKGMGKKVPEIMAELRDKFVDGYRNVADDHSAECADKASAIFDMLEEYSGYAFNKSHAVAYSMLTYVCAWLKAEYPMEFVCAQLKSQADDSKTKALLRDLNAEGYQYVPFDLEKSVEDWSIIDGKVYGGFTAVRGIGPRTARACLDRRHADPEGWTLSLTAAQRNRLLSPYNTPWHDLTRLTETYGHLYKEPWLANVRKGSILQLDEIPEEKGSYCFIGKLVKAVKREKADSGKDNWFINLYFEDDSGETGCTINRFKAAGFQYLLEEDALNKDYLVRADIINSGRKWFFLSKLKELPL
jgi:DNA polymerase III alpha subunit